MTSEVPGSVEKKSGISKFQELQQKIENIDALRYRGDPLSNQQIEERVSAVENRNRLIEEDPQAKKILEIVDLRLKGSLEEIASVRSPYEKIAELRERLVVTGQIDTDVSRSPSLRFVWDAGKFAGLPTYYYGRALDRLEIYFQEKEHGEDSVSPEIREYFKPEDWEWKVPADFSQRNKELQKKQKEKKEQIGGKKNEKSEKGNVESSLNKLLRGMTEDQFFEQVLHLEGVREDPRTNELSNLAWYTEASADKKELYKATALLARAAEQKRERSGSIDHLIPRVESVADVHSGPEITKLKKEQLIALISHSKVKEILSRYVRAIVDHEEFKFKKSGFDKENIFERIKTTEGPDVKTTIQLCNDEVELLHIREIIRDEFLEGDLSKEEINDIRLSEAIAYLLIYNGHLIESSDTVNSSPLGGKVIEKEEKDKIPNPNMNAYVGSGEMRYFVDPRSRVLEKIGKEGGKREGWGCYQKWITRMIAIGKGNLAAEIIGKYYPGKLGISFFENLTENSEKKRSLIECLYKGEDFDWESISENPFLLYQIRLAKLKAIYELFSSEAQNIKEGETEVLAAREASMKIIKLLQSVDMADLSKEGNALLAKQMAYAVYHNDGRNMRQVFMENYEIQFRSNTMGTYTRNLYNHGLTIKDFRI